MSRHVISSKAIARDLERNRDTESSSRRFQPGKFTLIVVLNLTLCIVLFIFAVMFDLI